jgi:short subunit dehydrogenase-like uncharacterized protein
MRVKTMCGEFSGGTTASTMNGPKEAATNPNLREGAILQKFVLPKPGEGPTPDAQRTGFFDLRFLGLTAEGRRVRAKGTDDRDPGYGPTGKMLGQAAACFDRDVDKAAKPGGFWTPAAIFGDRLISRLTMRSGLSFELDERSA